MSGDALQNNQQLHQGQHIKSKNGAWYLTMQTDGNLVLYKSHNFVSPNAVWSSNTNGRGTGPFRLHMQQDGNLVVYDGRNQPTWASNTNGKGQHGHRLVVQNDRNVVVYDGRNQASWATNTFQPDALDTLHMDGTLHQGEQLRSANGAYYLTMQTDGNLVAYNGNNFISQAAFWSSQTNGRGTGPYRLTMQEDGNLVVYDGRNQPTWASNTFQKGSRGHRLVVQNDRNVVVYDGNNTPTWASNTNI